MHILLTGSTGLLGQGVLKACLEAADVERITVLVRRATGHRHAKLDEIVLNYFSHAATVQDRLAGIDACFYCAGAPPVGTPERDYRHVTRELTLAVARAYASANPQGRFFYVSGARSDPHSRLMPLRVKGETEVALQRLSVTTVMLRPVLILPAEGTRSPHPLLRVLHTLARPFERGMLGRLPAVATTNLAIGRAMLALARDTHVPGVVENPRINALGLHR